MRIAITVFEEVKRLTLDNSDDLRKLQMFEDRYSLKNVGGTLYLVSVV